MSEAYHMKPIEEYTLQQRDFIKKDRIVECLYSGSGESCMVDCDLWERCWGSLKNESGK